MPETPVSTLSMSNLALSWFPVSSIRALPLLLGVCVQLSVVVCGSFLSPAVYQITALPLVAVMMALSDQEMVKLRLGPSM